MTARTVRFPWLWVMAGPFLVVVTLLLAIFHLGSEALYLPLLATIGIPLVAIWGQRGLFGTWALLAAVMPFYNSPWQLGAGISLAMALWVFHLVAGDFETKQKAIGEDQSELQAKLEALRAQFEAAVEEAERLSKLDRVKVCELTRLQSERNELLLELIDLRAQLLKRPPKVIDKTQTRALRRQLNTVRTDRAQLRLEADAYRQVALRSSEEIQQTVEAVRDAQAALEHGVTTFAQREEQLQQELEATKARLGKTAQTEAMLRQLRGQFEERNEVLHQTRKELWQTESEALRLKHEREEADHSDQPLFQTLSASEQSLHDAEEEIASLEVLVTDLINELKGRSVPNFA